MSIGEVNLFLEFFVSNSKIGMTFVYQSQVKVTVDFSADFARLLGLRSDETYVTGKDVISEREPNPSSNIRSVYVYCDLLESRYRRRHEGATSSNSRQIDRA